MLTRAIALATLLLGCHISPGVISAASADPARLEQARQLLAEGTSQSAEAAYEILVPLEDELIGDPAYDYLLGIAALDSGRPNEAIFALERVLAVDPGNTPARAEIARAYLAINELRAAEAEFEAARQAADVPPQARTAIDRYLDAISRPAAGVEPEFTSYVGVTMGWDSNVDGGPGDSLSVGGANISSGSGDLFGTLSGGFHGTIPFRRDVDLNFTGSFFNKWLESEHDFETRGFDGSAGVTFKVGRDRYSAGVNGGMFILNGDANRNAVGAVARWTRQLSARSQGGLFGEYAHYSFPSSRDAGERVRNVHRYVAGANYAQRLRLPRNPVVGGTIFYAVEDTYEEAFDQNGHNAVGLLLNARQRLSDKLTLFGTAGFEFRDFHASNTAIAVVFGDAEDRRDRRLSLALGLDFVPVPQWHVTPLVSFTRNISNHAVSDSSQAVVSLSVRRDFE